MKFLLLSLFLFQAGCASILSGNIQEVEIGANVEGVDVYLEETYLGKTPLTATLPRQTDQFLTFRKNGYKASKVLLRTRMNPNFWWNIPFTVVGVTGMSTDYGCGAIYQISPSKIQVRMKALDFKSQQTPGEEETEIFEIFGLQNLEKEKARHQTGAWIATKEHLQKNEASE